MDIECIVTLGRFDIAKALSAQLVDTDGASVGAAVAPIHTGCGRYHCLMSVASTHRGAIVVTDANGNVVQATAINPEEWLGVSTGGPHIIGHVLGRSGPSLAGRV